MNTIEINLSGEGFIYNFHPIMKPDLFKGNGFPNEMLAAHIIGPAIEMGVIKRHLSVEVGGRHLRKSKGEYVVCYDYVSHIIPCPAVAYQMASGVKFTQVFHITLPDDEKFKPKKLRLIKSKYEFPFYEDDYGILPDVIVYDGKAIRGDISHSYTADVDDLYPSLPLANWHDIPPLLNEEEYNSILNDALSFRLKPTSPLHDDNVI